MPDYAVIHEQAEDGAWGAYLPDLPGVVALGNSRDEVADGIREAVTAFRDDLHERGLDLPEPHHVTDVLAL